MKRGFTLAEILITLAIVGVIAAISIPSVISNTTQNEYRTGLKKAITVLNDAIQAGAESGMTPYDLDEKYTLFQYLKDNMITMKTTNDLSAYYYLKKTGSNSIIQNKVFYTIDGMRYEFISGDQGAKTNQYKTYETGEVLNVSYSNYTSNDDEDKQDSQGWNCGSFGLAKNSEETKTAPCLITVDVNGDRKPNPGNASCHSIQCASQYKIANPTGTKLTDTFSIIITEKNAIPYGTAAQRAMYSNKK